MDVVRLWTAAARGAAFVVCVALGGVDASAAAANPAEERVVCDLEAEAQMLAELGLAAPAYGLTAGPLPTPPYVRNRRVECLEAADINGKLETYPLTAAPADAYQSVLACMFRAGCYYPNIGSSSSAACLKELCICNQAVVRVPILCGSIGRSCAEVKKQLEKGGTVVLGLRTSSFGSMGHAVQVTSAECADENSGKIKIRDPDHPDVEVEFRVSEGRVRNPDSALDGLYVTEAYGTEPNW